MHAIYLGSVGGKILQSISKKQKCLITSCQSWFEFPHCKYVTCKKQEVYFDLPGQGVWRLHKW